MGQAQPCLHALARTWSRCVFACGVWRVRVCSCAYLEAGVLFAEHLPVFDLFRCDLGGLRLDLFPRLPGVHNALQRTVAALFGGRVDDTEVREVDANLPRALCDVHRVVLLDVRVRPVRVGPSTCRPVL